jgi:hypothetical protein
MDSLLGEAAPAGSGQIALRFPRPLDIDAPPPVGHLDWDNAYPHVSCWCLP